MPDLQNRSALSIPWVITRTWWPLAMSWLLMGLERPIVAAVIARFHEPEIHLAAYASVVFPLSLVIESPVIMLLAASTALTKNWEWYRFLRNIMGGMAILLTGLHMVVAFTPVYDFITSKILHTPLALVEPARIGMMLMTPWTASIAIRRFQQGILIRQGQSRSIGVGTAIRLVVLCAGLFVGLWTDAWSGIFVATCAISLGVMSEAAYIRICAHPVLQSFKQSTHTYPDPPDLKKFLGFYIPLAITPLLTLLALPISSAALSRMPHPIESFAVWPILGGLVFLFQGLGLAYQEVVVALIEKPGYGPYLRRFAFQLAAGLTGILLFITITPLARLWFFDLSGLPEHLTILGQTALWGTLLLPALTVLECWLQGILVHSRQTRGIIEAVTLYVLTSACILMGGIAVGTITGLYVGYLAAMGGLCIQTVWLRFRCKNLLQVGAKR